MRIAEVSENDPTTRHIYTALYSLTSAVLAATLAVLGQLAALLSRLLAGAPQAALGGVGLAQWQVTGEELVFAPLSVPCSTRGRGACGTLANRIHT